MFFFLRPCLQQGPQDGAHPARQRRGSRVCARCTFLFQNFHFYYFINRPKPTWNRSTISISKPQSKVSTTQPEPNLTWDGHLISKPVKVQFNSDARLRFQTGLNYGNYINYRQFFQDFSYNKLPININFVIIKEI